VDVSGNPLWDVNGVAIANAPSDLDIPVIAPDGSGGAIITWMDDRNSGSSGLDVYSQRVDASGNVQWTANGIAVCTASYDQSEPVIAPNGSGGAIIAWQDYRSNTDYDVYAQGISASGSQ